MFDWWEDFKDRIGELSRIMTEMQHMRRQLDTQMFGPNDPMSVDDGARIAEKYRRYVALYNMRKFWFFPKKRIVTKT